MSTSNLCNKSKCVSRIGTTFNPSETLDATVEAFSQELNFGVYDLKSVGTLNRTFRNTAVNFPQNSIDRLVSQYGDTSFYTSVGSFNQYFLRSEIRDLINPERYPNLYERIQNDIIFTPIEVAEFSYQFNYTPPDLTAVSSSLSPTLLNQVEDFYADNLSNSIIGKFCSLMPKIFGAIGAFFTLIDNVRDFVDQIRNFSLENALNSLMERLKTQVLQVIDRVVEKVRNIIENFSIENIVQEVRTFIDQRIVARFYELRERALSFFNELNLESFRERIQAMIDYATSIFQDPTLEEIQFLIYRFCNFASQIEQGINALADPLRAFANDYRTIFDTIAGSSNRNTARAIAAGAFRIDSEARRRAVAGATGPTGTRGSGTPSGGGTSGGSPGSPSVTVPLGDVRPPSADELRGVTQWNNGQGDSRVGFGGSVARLEWKWTDTSIEVRALLMRVQRRFGRRITVISGRRSYEEQLALWNDDLASNGGSPSGNVARPGSSQHETGLAFDVTWSGFNRETGRQFLQIAVEEGFTGIGGYPRSSFVHIDRRGYVSRWGDTFGVVPGGPVNSNPPDAPSNVETLPSYDLDDDDALEGVRPRGSGQTPNLTWSEDDARVVEDRRRLLNNLDAEFPVTQIAALTPAQLEYARSQGYNDLLPRAPDDSDPIITLADVRGEGIAPEE